MRTDGCRIFQASESLHSLPHRRSHNWTAEEIFGMNITHHISSTRYHGKHATQNYHHIILRRKDLEYPILDNLNPCSIHSKVGISKQFIFSSMKIHTFPSHDPR